MPQDAKNNVGVRAGRLAGSVAVVLAAVASWPAAHAGVLSISTAVGGAPTGVNYVNFDNLQLGNTGGTSGGVTVSFSTTGNAGVVTGSSSGYYAAPYLSNNNGTLFGDAANGADTTRYLTTGLGSVTIVLPGAEHYVGLLWGSVDTYNTLQFYSGNTLVDTITGSDISANANGNQGASGTYYVNIDSLVPQTSFDKIVASSTKYAFEFDNLAYNTTVPAPEIDPGSTLAALTLLAGALVVMRGRKVVTQ